MLDFLDTNKQNEIESLIKINNYMDYKDIILKFLQINHDNKLKINSKNFNISENDEFYVYINKHNLNKLISQIIGIIYGKYIFNDVSNSSEINNTLNANGVYIHNEAISNDICDAIINKINHKNFNSLNNKKFINHDIFNSSPGTSWISDHKDVIEIEEVQKLVTNPFILNIAQNYLGCIPILAQTNFWVSKYGSNDQTNFFHQDYDDVNFLKIFIYLTDVNENNGSHSYVKGSLNNMITPLNYKPSDRINNETMYKNYGNENILNICGKKGTIIFEDTNGFHKGNILIEGYRFILQLEYCSSTKFLDNKIYFINELNKSKNSVLYNAKVKYPDTFILYNFD